MHGLRRRLVLLLLVPGAGAASQSTYRVSLGPEESARQNPAQSPYVYSGWGWAGSFGYERAWSGSAVDLSFGVAAGSVSSDISGSSADRWSAGAAIGYLRRIPRRLAGGAWHMGGRVSAFSDVAQHDYPRMRISDEFGYATFAASPALRSTWRVQGVTLANRLSVPVASFVLFPYANAKMATVGDLRFAGPSRVRGFDEAISYRAGPSTSRHLTWTYRVSWLRYVAADVRTYAQQSLSLEIGMPRGSAGR